MFKESFKYYKSKVPMPDFADVIDFDTLTPEIKSKCRELHLSCDQFPNDDYTNSAGLESIHKWKCYELNGHPGLTVIRCPFNTQAQRYWIARCLRDYPRHPNVVNLNEHLFSSKVLTDWWQELQLCEDKNEARRMKISMRWATLGYHHNWDTKIYSEEMRAPFPADLAELCNFFATVLGFRNFQAQAAIVNYYPIGTTLAGHTDHSEQNLDAPLFSFSFGQTAIFLIGGETKDEKPTAIFLKSGDVLVMSKKSRLCYHAVPRVMKATEEPWNLSILHEKSACASTLHSAKKIRTDIDYLVQLNGQRNAACYDSCLYQQVRDETFWRPFQSYLNDSRININVRQVLKENTLSLTDPSSLSF